MTALIALPTAIMLRKKLFNSMITDAPAHIRPWSKAWIRSKITFPFSDAISANSLAGLKSYRTPLKKSFCIYNGFNFTRLDNLVDKRTILSRFEITTPKIVGMVAEFAPRKDYPTYIRAALSIARARNDVTFVAVGDGPSLNDCKKLVGEEFQERIRFLGSQNDVESIVNIFDVGVLTTFTEGISNSILEYMALGKPVVATDGGGTREIVEDRITGYLIQPFDYAILAEKLLFLLDHDDVARTLGEAGRSCIQKKFRIDSMVNSFVDLYKKLTEAT